MADTRTPDEEVLDAARQVVEEFHAFGEILQSDKNDAYGPLSGIGRLQLACEAKGLKFRYEVTGG